MNKKVLAGVLVRVIHHSLTHETDPGDLAEAIDLLKYMRDEPEKAEKRLAYWGGEDPFERRTGDRRQRDRGVLTLPPKDWGPGPLGQAAPSSEKGASA